MVRRNSQKQVRILQALNRIHHSIGANSELEMVFRISIEELFDIVRCDRCVILSIAGKTVRILAQDGFSKKVGNKEYAVVMAVLKHTVKRRRCISSGDVASSSAPTGGHMGSLICAPLLVGEQVRGVIHLDSPEKDVFDDDDLHFVELLADEIALAMERAPEHPKPRAQSAEDSLTACFIRKKLDEDIDAEISRARRYEKTFTILLIEVDWFKKYRDWHGHAKGEEVLRNVAVLFKGNVRASDKIYRYDGSEFVVLLPETDKQEGVIVAQRLREIIARTRFDGERKSQPNKKVTISIGVAGYPRDGNVRDEILQSANAELERAKQEGRNKICVFNQQEQP
jgi:diguanylate cyclase (GGDEF)-like protein